MPAELRLPGDLGALLTPIDTGDVCVNVDAGWFADKGLAPPTTLADLADPAYRDLLVVQSPVTSSPGLAFLIGTVDEYGADGWEDYWAALRANGVRVRPSWDDAYFTDYTVSGGDRPLVVSYASSPPAEVVLSETGATEPSSTVMTDTLRVAGRVRRGAGRCRTPGPGPEAGLVHAHPGLAGRAAADQLRLARCRGAPRCRRSSSSGPRSPGRPAASTPR